jgi:hypothetical protein
MEEKIRAVKVLWQGPFGWPGFENDNKLPSIPKESGVYLQTFEYKDGYIIYLAGLTRRSTLDRFKEHTRSYMLGKYNVLNVAEIKSGVRKEVWHGWSYARAHQDEFERREKEIIEAIKMQLRAFRIFTAEIECESRLLERLESGIMRYLYQQASPFCDIPDKGMMLSRRHNQEPEIKIENVSLVVLHCLPQYLEI